MSNLRKKAKLVSVLKRLGDKSYSEAPIVKELIKDLENTKSALSPYMSEIDVIKKQQSVINSSLQSLTESLTNKEKVIFDLVSLLNESKIKGDESSKIIKTYLADIELMKLELLILKGKGGGSMNQKISIAGTWATSRYADFNFIAGSNMTISSVNNDVAKRLDITFASTGGSGGNTTVYNDAVSGTINGVNKIFTVPNLIGGAISLVLANSSYQNVVDYTFSAKTITFVTAPDASLSGQPFWMSYTAVGTAVFNDTVSGTINGINKIFTVANTITASILLVLANSPYQSGVDYTASGTTITFATAPDTSLSGQPFWFAHL